MRARNGNGIILLTTLMVLVFGRTAWAADVTVKPTVAVMDFSNYEGGATHDINLTGVGRMVSDYIIEALTDSGQFEVSDKDVPAGQLTAENLNVVGTIDPDTARRLGEILGVKYIIYGNVNGVSGDSFIIEVMLNGANIHTVEARIIACLMEVETGDIVAVARGEGKSKSSLVKAGKEGIGYIAIGSKKISQVSVHNAVKKAAYNMVDVLVRRFYENT